MTTLEALTMLAIWVVNHCGNWLLEIKGKLILPDNPTNSCLILCHCYSEGILLHH